MEIIFEKSYLHQFDKLQSTEIEFIIFIKTDKYFYKPQKFHLPAKIAFARIYLYIDKFLW